MPRARAVVEGNPNVWLLNMRKKLGMNQMDFWGKIGVTQSGGSRYESGRNIPKPTIIALHVVYTPSTELSTVLESIRNGTFQFPPVKV